jgi:Crp-like helix-turn-helix domain
LLVLRHLADRWGVVTAEGTVLPLPFSHDLLAQLAGARRSTVTLAVGALEREGAIRRLEDGCWLLTRVAERRVQATSKTVPSRILGETLRLRIRASAMRDDARALQAEARLARGRRPGRW